VVHGEKGVERSQPGNKSMFIRHVIKLKRLDYAVASSGSVVAAELKGVDRYNFLWRCCVFLRLLNRSHIPFNPVFDACSG